MILYTSTAPDYAAKLVNSLKDGIMHAFTLFAPRRMEKTKFLLNDIETGCRSSRFQCFLYFPLWTITVQLNPTLSGGRVPIRTKYQ
ncbi:hypothetical protein [Neisseria wadsworthii]|uniref:Uncharacterized protein n=1 Tax=Neisseria wadsworthii 9715 TaxID=1030841 RepID=G4CST6_9NEIS|nr:hypothetical protein [Neisseria wadsworthii]EGZ44551.1 hypothetical protein HMPREF9370_2077 [Neisseria wadsworthii 9715]